MGIPLLGLHSEIGRDQFPLLMERFEGNEHHQHVINITISTDAPSSLSHCADGINQTDHTVDRASSSSMQQIHSSQTLSSSGRVNFQDPSSDAYTYTSPLNSGLWISIELIVTLAQIVAAIVILSLSRYNSTEAPLFAWVVGYACGCLATLPILYWRLRNCNHSRQQYSVQSYNNSEGIITPERTTSSSLSLTQEEDSQLNSHRIARNDQLRRRISTQFNGIVDHFKMALDCFFAVWFVVGNVWIFGTHSSPAVAPKLYRLCIVFLTFSCIGYALPFLLCATILCCLPCIISVMGIREDLSKVRGASTETIDALPTYKIKLSKGENIDEQICLKASNGQSAGETQKELLISREDAACCICLAAYIDNDDLRELPCSHLFHTECVDKWLKINALCPLCKLDIGVDDSRASGSDHIDRNQENPNDEGEANSSNVVSES